MALSKLFDDRRIQVRLEIASRIAPIVAKLEDESYRDIARMAWALAGDLIEVATEADTHGEEID